MTALRVVVVGAGAFGGWTALALQRRGARVTLIDAWGAGHARASSGGESRVIRAAYGSRAVYTELSLRALDLWRAFDPDRRLLRETGVLWLFGQDDGFGRASADVMRQQGGGLEELAMADAARRYPQIAFGGVRTVFWEPNAGFLHARLACLDVVERFVLEGGDYRCRAARTPVETGGDALVRLPLTDGTSHEADAFVFACGPWLPEVFPEAVGPRIATPRQDVLYFGTPSGNPDFHADQLPVWMDFAAGSREGQIYGVPATRTSGFKVADDAPGPAFDPTNGDRIVGPESVARARAFLAMRFPALAKSPLVGSEVCQYEATPDAHLIVDRHPRSSNVWILGGGSGHGFKMGPAIGEMMAAVLLDGVAPDPQFSLARFVAPPAGGWAGRWS
jgi:glycine/D-amino acid oxidase-like deaminating enzyme